MPAGEMVVISEDSVVDESIGQTDRADRHEQRYQSPGPVVIAFVPRQKREDEQHSNHHKHQHAKFPVGLYICPPAGIGFSTDQSLPPRLDNLGRIEQTDGSAQQCEHCSDRSRGDRGRKTPRGCGNRNDQSERRKQKQQN